MEPRGRWPEKVWEPLLQGIALYKTINIVIYNYRVSCL